MPFSDKYSLEYRAIAKFSRRAGKNPRPDVVTATLALGARGDRGSRCRHGNRIRSRSRDASAQDVALAARQPASRRRPVLTRQERKQNSVAQVAGSRATPADCSRAQPSRAACHSVIGVLTMDVNRIPDEMGGHRSIGRIVRVAAGTRISVDGRVVSRLREPGFARVNERGDRTARVEVTVTGRVVLYGTVPLGALGALAPRPPED